jgi:predicted O-methyltransferase YrrM
MKDIKKKDLSKVFPTFPHDIEVEIMGYYRATERNDAELLVRLGLAIGAENILELGTWEGDTTLLLSHYFDKVYTVDIQPKVELHIDNVVQICADSLKYDTYAAIPPPIHLAFIDGGHEYTNVVTDTFHALRLITNGGLIVFHDVASWPDVKLALDDLSYCFDIYHIVDDNHIGNMAFVLI